MRTRTLPVAVLAGALAAMVGYADTLGVLAVLPCLQAVLHGPSTGEATVVLTVVSLAAPAIALIIAFVIGVVGGSLVGHWAQVRRRQAVLALTALLFALAAFLVASLAAGSALLIMLMALGALNGALEDLPGAFVGLLEMVGRSAARLAETVSGGTWHGWGADLLLWIGFLVGIAGGLVVNPHAGLGALWLAAGVAALLSACCAIPGFRPQR